MNRISKITFLLLCAAAMALASCDRENTPEITGGTAVNFTTGIATRTNASGNQWLTSDEVGIFMVTHGGTLPTDIVGGAATGADNRLYKPVTEGASSALAPAADQTIYYPQMGNVDFIAYYPWRATPADDPYVYKVSVSDQSAPAAIDLLWAKSTNVAKSSTPVAFAFAHKLSKLTLNMKAGEGFAASDIEALLETNISIQGMPATADFALATGALTAGEAGNISPLKAATANTGSAATFSAIVVPQAANTTGRSVIFTVGGKGYVWNIPATAAFEAGQHHTYTITVSPAVITPWTADAGGSGTGTASRLYKVGDYYPDPNVTFDAGVVTSGTAPIGVVYWLESPVGAAAAHGKIVSLDERGWSIWAGFSTENVAGIDDPDDGAKGTKNMITKMENDGAFASGPGFPGVFSWLYEEKNGSDVSGRWYIPAKNELKALYAAYCGKRYEDIGDWGDEAFMPEYYASASAQAAFNAKLTAAAGGQALADYWYWSSTQISGDHVWVVAFDIGGYTLSSSKDNGNQVRAVSAF